MLCLSYVVLGDCRADVVFVLDSSGSIGFLDWFRVKQFVLDVVQGLKVMKNQTRVGVVSFATTVRPEFHLEQFKSLDTLLPVIWDIDYMAGVTNTAAGLRRMHKMFKR
ncbi:hypothetical protein NP493_806g00002 [Ridgeia piscesae]|uniref:VWFA domain-containing protein n=1 Tax=Ridgeia piscesae TaxID=27915 RepID=A0AAD9KNC5_RIDPI|nr:hypothetical protein NP493_806g00002 [Ridgeia piscesae]